MCAPMPDDLQLQIPMIRQMLEAMRVPILGVPGFEADDVIATVAAEGDNDKGSTCLFVPATRIAGSY